MREVYLKQLEVIDEQLISDLDICDFQYYLQNDEFAYIFERIHKIFVAESLIYGLTNPVFIFGNSDTLNACAKRHKTCNIILFNRGLVLTSINEILNNQKLKDFNLDFKATLNILKFLSKD